MTTYIPVICSCGNEDQADATDLDRGVRPVCTYCGDLMHPFDFVGGEDDSLASCA